MLSADHLSKHQKGLGSSGRPSKKGEMGQTLPPSLQLIWILLLSGMSLQSPGLLQSHVWAQRGLRSVPLSL